MAGGDRTAKKAAYFTRLAQCLLEYKSIFIVNVDNVSSKQMALVRISMRGSAVVLMGKNTMMRKQIRALAAESPRFERLLPYICGNVGLVFTNKDLKEIRELILGNRVAAPAKAGAIAPVDVFLPAINTGIEPGKTSFFQALSIPTKIARGTIEIVNQVHLIKVGAKVGASEATLLNMLNISPFTYGLGIEAVYDNGAIFDVSVLDVTDDMLIAHVLGGIRNVAAISLATGYATSAAVPHAIVNVFKKVLAASLASDYTIPQAEKAKEYLADPSKFASAIASAAPAAAASGSAAPAAAKEEEKKQEEEEESDADMGLGLFD